MTAGDKSRTACGFCHDKPVQDAASWLDGKERLPAPCPRCGETYDAQGPPSSSTATASEDANGEGLPVSEDDLVQMLKDDMADAIRRAYVGTEPWHVGPAHLGIEVAPEAVALEPPHARRIARIHEAVCMVIDNFGIESAASGEGEDSGVYQ